MLITWMQGGADFIVLKNLDVDGIRIIGSVLGQSIALDHYIRQVIFRCNIPCSIFSIYLQHLFLLIIS